MVHNWWAGYNEARERQEAIDHARVARDINLNNPPNHVKYPPRRVRERVELDSCQSYRPAPTGAHCHNAAAYLALQLNTPARMHLGTGEPAVEVRRYCADCAIRHASAQPNKWVTATVLLTSDQASVVLLYATGVMGAR